MRTKPIETKPLVMVKSGEVVVLLVLLCALVALGTLFAALALVFVRRAYFAVVSRLTLFVTPNDKGDSQLSVLTDGLAAVVAHRLVTSITASLRGMAGGETRSQLADQASENPLLAMVPGIGGKLGKQKALLTMLAMLGSRLMRPSGLTPEQSTGSNGQAKFKLGV